MHTHISGKKGEIYTTQDKFEVYDFDHDEGEGKIGWWQVTESKRVKVIRRRTGHMSCIWVVAKKV